MFHVPTRPLLLLVALAALALPGPGQVSGAASGIEPSDEEQLGIYEVNLARHDPPAYGVRIGVDLSGVAAQPALAVNRCLTASARFHADEMLAYDYFAHTSAVTGDGPNQMAVDHGYDLFGNGLGKDWGTANYIESLAYGYNLVPGFDVAIAMLIEDSGVPSLGHRIHLLAMSSWFEQHREIGCGRAASGSRRYYSIHTGDVHTTDLFVTGVVYDDANDNGRYDLGEGLGGVTVSAGGLTTTTMSAGGYSIPIGPGSWTVTCSGGSFGGPATASAVVAGDNVEVDFRHGVAGGDVDFEPAAAPPPPPPPEDSDPEIVASVLDGLAPLGASFSADVGDPGVTLAWDFGDGGSSTAVDVDHVFSSPGLYPVVLRASGPGGTFAAVVVVSVGAATGAGPGTTPPSSTDLRLPRLKAKVKHGRIGSDKVTLRSELELPAGLVGAAHRLVVCVGALRITVVLDDRGKAESPEGARVSLKLDRPADGSPLGPGVLARLKLKVRGDLASRLDSIGMRNEARARSPSECPVAVLLNDLPYRGSASVSIESSLGQRSVARPVD